MGERQAGRKDGRIRGLEEQRGKGSTEGRGMKARKRGSGRGRRVAEETRSEGREDAASRPSKERKEERERERERRKGCKSLRETEGGVRIDGRGKRGMERRLQGSIM